jgi:hypothetical protein
MYVLVSFAMYIALTTMISYPFKSGGRRETIWEVFRRFIGQEERNQ